jgi:hypothetical protein
MSDQLDSNPSHYNVSEETIRDYDQWKQFLGSRVQMAHNVGMSDDRIAATAARVGDFLAARVDVKNNEERVLKDLWASANEQEQTALASMIVKMVSDGSVQ